VHKTFESSNSTFKPSSIQLGTRLPHNKQCNVTPQGNN